MSTGCQKFILRLDNDDTFQNQPCALTFINLEQNFSTGTAVTIYNNQETVALRFNLFSCFAYLLMAFS